MSRGIGIAAAACISAGLLVPSPGGAAVVESAQASPSSGIVSSRRDAKVDVPDPALRVVIWRALHRSSVDSLTLGDLARLTELAAAGANISDLRGLEHATNLRRLSLTHGHIRDLAPLSRLPLLGIVQLGGNDITDVRAFRDMSSLDALSLEHNRISDVSPLRDLHRRGVAIDVSNQGQSWRDSTAHSSASLELGTVHLAAGRTELTHQVREIIDVSGTAALPVQSAGMPYSVQGHDITWQDIPRDAAVLLFRFSAASGIFNGVAQVRIERDIEVPSATPTPDATERSASALPTTPPTATATEQTPGPAGESTLKPADRLFEMTHDGPKSFETPKPVPTIPRWDPTAGYGPGDIVTWNGHTYLTLQSHRGWGDPAWITAPSLWLRLTARP